MPKFILLLQTADRSEYTIKTVDFFLKYNDISNYVAYVVDDASRDMAGVNYAFKKGFGVLYKNDYRMGCSKTLSIAASLLAEQHSPDDRVLYLQNDIEFLRPLSQSIINTLFDEFDVTTVRLFGDYKEIRKGVKKYTRDSRKIKENLWKTVKIIENEKIGFENTKWSCQPNITLVGNLAKFTLNACSEKDIIKTAKSSGCLVARFENSVVTHIGYARTPEGKYT